MIPIHELLARIRWDAEFGKGRFRIGYFDRKRQSLVHLPLERIRTESGFGFTAVEDDGTVHSVPYHGVREVWRCYFSVQPSVDLRSSARIGPPRRPSASANLWNCSSWIISAAY